MKESDGHLRCSFALWRLMGCLGRVSVHVCVHLSPGICLVSQQRLLKLLVEGEVQIFYQLRTFCYSSAQFAQGVFSGIPAWT